MTHFERALAWRKIVRSERSPVMTVATLATFTIEPIEAFLGTALEALGLPAHIHVGPYDQVVQECLSDESATARANPSVLLVWARLEELWRGRPLPLVEPEGDTEPHHVRDPLELAEAALDAARRWRALLVFVLPAIPEIRPLGVGDANALGGVFATATAAREALRRRLAGQRGVVLVDAEEVVREIGARVAYAPERFAVARIPFADALFAALADRVARMISLTRSPARKVVVVDGDHTLWSGVVGEDGPEGIDLADHGPGEAHRDFQSFLLEVRRAGVLIALCSKNDPHDIDRVFERSDMVLRREHLAAMRAAWRPKSVLLREMAEELGLGTDSFVFIDDSGAEILEVKENLPEVACVHMPADPARWRDAVLGAGVLDRLPPTDEDLQRAEQYGQERARAEERVRAGSTAEYLARLGVEVTCFAPSGADLARLAQLVAKTNQFNLNGRRRTEAELAELTRAEGFIVRLSRARDRFGDYGIVGALVVDLHRAGGVAELDTFVLSCRALSRGVEDAMLADAFAEAKTRGVEGLRAAIVETPRNEPARTFFGRLGATTAPEPAGPLRAPSWPAHVTRGACA